MFVHDLSNWRLGATACPVSAGDGLGARCRALGLVPSCRVFFGVLALSIAAQRASWNSTAGAISDAAAISQVVV